MKRLLCLLCLPCLLLCLNACSVLRNTPSANEQRLAVQYDDAGIKTSVTSALLRHNPSKANDVDVHCFQGAVYLVGEADAEFRAYALASARQTAGVTQVQTHWFPIGTAATATDLALKAAILGKITPLAVDGRFDLDVWGGQAVLIGILSSPQRADEMIGMIRSVHGVKAVISYLVTQ